jgi:integrase
MKADTGIRLGELLALRPDDVRVEGGKNVLKVRGKGDGKGWSRSRRAVSTVKSLCRPRPRGGQHDRLDAITQSAVEHMQQLLLNRRFRGSVEAVRLLERVDEFNRDLVWRKQ